ncbi:unnamed protein product [Adineta steineri]|uniref:Uncharacterized protein n=1 Tax=Adineta steineri TaxID=433720 RepID=A0A814NAI6_9BILA|nr:unnamed protein product [Adineta steineri]CAF3976567.1 unnamed protein product [Adineta steineri]
MFSNDRLKLLLQRRVLYKDLQERIITSNRGDYNERRVKDAQVRVKETCTQLKIIQVILEHINDHQHPQAPVIINQTTENLLPINDTRDEYNTYDRHDEHNINNEFDLSPTREMNTPSPQNPQ